MMETIHETRESRLSEIGCKNCRMMQTTIEDLKSTLKLEKMDHQITKKEVAEAQRQQSEYSKSIQSIIDTKISEIKSIHAVERQHLQQRLEMTTLKLENLQIQYDDIIARTIEECQNRRNSDPNGFSQEQSQMFIEQILRSQADFNDQQMSKFVDEIKSLKLQVVQEVKNAQVRDLDDEFNNFNSSQKINPILENTLKSLRLSGTKEIKLEYENDQKFKNEQYDLKKFRDFSFVDHSQGPTVCQSTQIDNLESYVEKNFDSIDFTKYNKKETVNMRSLNQTKRYMSPQPAHHVKQLLSVDFENKQAPLQNEPEIVQKPAPEKNNLMSFQKMVKEAANAEKTPKRQPKNDGSPTSEQRKNPFQGSAGRYQHTNGSPNRYEPFRDSVGDTQVAHIDIRKLEIEGKQALMTDRVNGRPLEINELQINQDQKLQRQKQRQIRAKARLYGNRSQTRPHPEVNDQSQLIPKLQNQTSKLNHILNIQMQKLQNDNQYLRARIYAIQKESDKAYRQLEKELQEVKIEKQYMEKLIENYFKKAEVSPQKTDSKNVTLNVTEQVSNWSFFNIFDTRKQSPDTKKYRVEITDNTSPYKDQIINQKKQSTNFHLYQGNLVKQESVNSSNGGVTRFSEVFDEQTIKSPIQEGGYKMKHKNEFQDDIQHILETHQEESVMDEELVMTQKQKSSTSNITSNLLAELAETIVEMDMTTPPGGLTEHLEGKQSVLESQNYINFSKKTTALPTESTVNENIDLSNQKLNINSTEYFTFHKKEAIKKSNFKTKLLEYGTNQN